MFGVSMNSLACEGTEREPDLENQCRETRGRRAAGGMHGGEVERTFAWNADSGGSARRESADGHRGLGETRGGGSAGKRGARRVFRVLKQRGGRSASPPANRAKRLLILAPEGLGELGDVSRRVVDHLRETMSVKGWRVDLRVLDFVHVKGVQRSWDSRIEVDDLTCIIAIYGRKPLAEWALKRKVRMLFLGGGTGGLPVSLVGVKTSHMAADALEKLTALGHQRIVIPLCSRTEMFNSSIREATKSAIEAAGGVFVETYHTPESDYLQPDVSTRILETVFARETPSALMFLEWKEFVSGFCFVTQLGLNVPQDVSMVLLNDTVEAAWFQPTLARFQFPIQRMVSAMVRWLEDESAESKNVILSADYLPGNSVARVWKP